MAHIRVIHDPIGETLIIYCEGMCLPSLRV